jgi:hypothetical protein
MRKLKNFKTIAITDDKIKRKIMALVAKKED